MGLLKAGIGAVSGALADSWRDYFYCDAIDSATLAVRGVKKVGGKSSNTKGSDNVISNGSIINVNEGQCALIVDGGKVAEVCAEAGEFVFDSSTEPSIFYGDLGDSIMETFKSIGKRFSFGGSAPVDQRVYFINTKEIMNNLYGTATPIPFRVVDRNIGLDVDVSLRCNGQYTYRITNPVLFYTNVCGNFAGVSYTKSSLDSAMKGEIVGALQPALGKFSDEGIRPSALPSHASAIADALNAELSGKWGKLRGITIASFSMNAPSLPPEDQEMIKNLQRTAVMRDPGMAAAHLTMAQGDAMKTAAGNAGGAMMGFMGMNMAQQQGGINAANLYGMAAQQQAMAQQQAVQQAAPQASQPTAANTWKCSCGASNTGKFCPTCGAKKPETNFWSCSCGAQNQGKFCMNCGKPKPAGVPQYKCDKCGWTPEDPTNPPKFCPECGDPFNADDIV